MIKARLKSRLLSYTGETLIYLKLLEMTIAHFGAAGINQNIMDGLLGSIPGQIARFAHT